MPFSSAAPSALFSNTLSPSVATWIDALPADVSAALRRCAWPIEESAGLRRFGGFSLWSGLNISPPGERVDDPLPAPGHDQAQRAVFQALARSLNLALSGARPAEGSGLFSEIAASPLREWLGRALNRMPHGVTASIARSFSAHVLRFPPDSENLGLAALGMAWSRQSPLFAQEFARGFFLCSQASAIHSIASLFECQGALAPLFELLRSNPSRDALMAEAHANPCFFAFLAKAGAAPSPSVAQSALALIFPTPHNPPQTPSRGFRAKAHPRWSAGGASGAEQTRDAAAALFGHAWPLRASWPWIWADYAAQTLSAG